jgi:ABC-type transporter Mla maintaining outer membrane lipid asymmetry ATPase subunit MlaF
VLETLAFEKLSLRDENGKAVLQRVDFRFPDEGILWVRASSGGGKSALLRLLVGLLDPSEGRYLLCGRDVAGMSFEELAPFRRRMGYSFEFGGLLSNRTVRQNLMLPFSYHRSLSAEDADARVQDFLRRFSLESVAEARPAQASGGLRKAACVARALIVDPEMLMLDHPTAGMDDRNKRALTEAILDGRARGTLRRALIVTEDAAFMAGLPHQALRMAPDRLEVAAA